MEYSDDNFANSTNVLRKLFECRKLEWNSIRFIDENCFLLRNVMYCVIDIETLPSRSQTVSEPFNRSIYDLSRWIWLFSILNTFCRISLMRQIIFRWYSWKWEKRGFEIRSSDFESRMFKIRLIRHHVFSRNSLMSTDCWIWSSQIKRT